MHEDLFLDELDPKRLLDLPSSPSEEFQVKDLHGQTHMNSLVSLFCQLCNFPQFDQKFFAAEHPLHRDFIPDPIAQRNFRIFVAAVIIFCSLAGSLALGLIFYTLWSMLTGNITLSELPLALVGIYLLSLPFFFYFSSRVETAWRRYASFVYKNAEPKTVFATASQRSTARGISIWLTYPNGYGEVVYAKFYNYDYKVIQKLFKEKPVCMLRDRTSHPAAVILEIDGDRIWCVSLS